MRIMWFYSDKERKKRVYINLDKITHFADCVNADGDGPACVVNFENGDFMMLHQSAEEVAADISLDRGLV